MLMTTMAKENDGDDGGDDDHGQAQKQQCCCIRVADQWLTWKEGEVLIFDDSYEHEVINMTDSIRVVLLFRFWHPDLVQQPTLRDELLDRALRAKRREELRRYNPPVPVDGNDTSTELGRQRRRRAEADAAERRRRASGLWAAPATVQCQSRYYPPDVSRRRGLEGAHGHFGVRHRVIRKRRCYY